MNTIYLNNLTVNHNTEIKKIEELASIVSGATPSKKVDSYYYKGNIPWITPKDLANNSSVFTSRGQINITELGLEHSSAKLLPQGSVLFSSRAPIGYISIANNSVTTNQGFKSLVPDKGYSSEILFLLLKNNQELIKSVANGSTFLEVSGNALKTLSVIVPNKKICIKLTEILRPMFLQIKINEEQTNKLKSLRSSMIQELI